MGFNHVTISPIGGYPPDDNIQSAPINLSNLSGITGIAATVIAAVAGKKITVHSMLIGTNGNTFLEFCDLASNGNTISSQGGLNFPGSQFFVIPFQQYPWFTTAAGDAFCIANANAAGTTNVQGRILYVQA